MATKTLGKIDQNLYDERRYQTSRIKIGQACGGDKHQRYYYLVLYGHITLDEVPEEYMMPCTRRLVQKEEA